MALLTTIQPRLRISTMVGIDHIGITIPLTKLEEEVKFLETALAPSAVKELFRPAPEVLGMGDSMGNPFLWVSALEHDTHKPGTSQGLGWHVAFRANGERLSLSCMRRRQQTDTRQRRCGHGQEVP